MDIQNSPRLPLRCEPIPGESFNGFIARLAEANSFDKVAWIADVAKVRFPQVWYSDEEIEAFAAVTGIDFATLKAMVPTKWRWKGNFGVSPVFGHDVPAYAFVRDLRRVCPRCLLESPHHRAIWDLRFVRSCVDHGIRLLAACPLCRRPLDWRTKSVRLCNCGCPLGGENLSRWAPTVPLETIEGPRYLQAMLHDIEQPVPDLLIGLDFDEVLYLLWRFGYFGSGRSSFKLDDSVEPEVEIWLTRGLQLLWQGPTDLQRTLLKHATSVAGRPKKKDLAILTDVHATLKEIGPRAAPLEEIVRAVLSELASLGGNSIGEVAV